MVRVGDAALEYLGRYLGVRGNEPGQLFLSKYGREIRPNSIRVMLRRLAERVGVPHVHPRKFRHIFATWAIESEAQEIDAQFLLGQEKAARAHAKWSPGDRLVGTVCS